MELDTKNIKPFIIINSRGIFLFFESDLFINPNDIDIKKTEPNNRIRHLLYYCYIFKNFCPILITPKIIFTPFLVSNAHKNIIIYSLNINLYNTI